MKKFPTLHGDNGIWMSLMFPLALFNLVDTIYFNFWFSMTQSTTMKLEKEIPLGSFGLKLLQKLIQRFLTNLAS